MNARISSSRSQKEADGNGLHPSRAQPPADFIPEERADQVPYEAVEDAAGLLGFKLVLVQLLRPGDRLPYALAVISLKRTR